MVDETLIFDQTLPEWLSMNKEDDLGTALFGVVSYENGAPDLFVQAISDIKYSTSQNYAQYARCFKWIPHRIMRTDDVHILCSTEGLTCHHIVTCGTGCMCYGTIGDYRCTRPRALYKMNE